MTQHEASSAAGAGGNRKSFGKSARPVNAAKTKGLSKRGAARLAAVQALYQMELTDNDAETIVLEFTTHRFGESAEAAVFRLVDKGLFADIVRSVARHEEFDDMIAGALSEDWAIDRLDSVLRATLRAATFELSERLDVPLQVIISEYVDIAHAFFTGREPAIVNGVLDSIGRVLRQEEAERKR